MFSGKKFDVEHALSMYATSYVQMPAWGIYEADVVAEFRSRIDTCHIYIIGTLPAVEMVDDRSEGGKLIIGLGEPLVLIGLEPSQTIAGHQTAPFGLAGVRAGSM